LAVRNYLFSQSEPNTYLANENPIFIYPVNIN